MKKQHLTIVVTFFFALAVLSFASLAFAQSGTEKDLCTGDALAVLFCKTSMSDMLNEIFKLAIAVGGILAMLRISWAGWLYMGSGFDNWGSKTKAKQVFSNAIIGLLVLMAVWLILYQINPHILELNIAQKKLNGTAAPTTAAPAQQNNLFTTPPAQNSFVNGAGGFDPSLNGCGVGGCNNPTGITDTGIPTGF